jgi:hypothetical protein
MGKTFFSTFAKSPCGNSAAGNNSSTKVYKYAYLHSVAGCRKQQTMSPWAHLCAPYRFFVCGLVTGYSWHISGSALARQYYWISPPYFHMFGFLFEMEFYFLCSLQRYTRTPDAFLASASGGKSFPMCSLHLHPPIDSIIKFELTKVVTIIQHLIGHALRCINETILRTSISNSIPIMSVCRHISPALDQCIRVVVEVNIHMFDHTWFISRSEATTLAILIVAAVISHTAHRHS